jgi:TatD DNase family protein
MQFHKFDEDYDAVIKEAFNNGLTHLVNTGTSIESSRQAVELAQKYENTYAIVGIHPHHADKMTVGHPEQSEGPPEDSGKRDSSATPQNDNNDWQIEQLEKLAKQPKVIGIGETGLDYFSYKSNGVVEKKLQEDAFRKQIELSIKLNLPLQIHNRLAWDDTFAVLSDYKSKLKNPPGMFHCFSGDIAFTKKVLEMGFYVGFDGNITYGAVPPKETTALVDLVKYVPIDRILTETDSPFLSPVPLRGQRNTPSNISLILDFIAKEKRVNYNTLEAQIERNFRSLFCVS